MKSFLKVKERKKRKKKRKDTWGRAAGVIRTRRLGYHGDKQNFNNDGKQLCTCTLSRHSLPPDGWPVMHNWGRSPETENPDSLA